jgi:hypothetical protein
MRIRDGKIRIRDPGRKIVGSGIRDKHPESATLETSQVDGSKRDYLYGISSYRNWRR